MNIYLSVLLMILIAVLFDEKTCKIPNRLIITGAVLGVLTSFYCSGINGIWISLVGIFTPIVILFMFYALNMIGAGDIKLFSVVGSFLGAVFALKIIVFSILAGGVMALIIAFARKNSMKRFKNIWNYFIAIYLNRKITAYQTFTSENDGLFKFSYAILFGFILTYFFEFN